MDRNDYELVCAQRKEAREMRMAADEARRAEKAPLIEKCREIDARYKVELDEYRATEARCAKEAAEYLAARKARTEERRAAREKETAARVKALAKAGITLPPAVAARLTEREFREMVGGAS